MPFYDYKCQSEDCGHEMPNQLKPYSEKVIKCEKCGNAAERLFSGRFVAHGLPNGHIAARPKRLAQPNSDNK